MMGSGEEKTNILINSSGSDVRYGSLGPIHRENFRIYKRRWYILLMFSVCSAVNAVKWNTWSPIQGTSQVVFGWSDRTITLLVAWGPILYIVMFLPMSWLMDVKGKKKTILQYYLTVSLICTQFIHDFRVLFRNFGSWPLGIRARDRSRESRMTSHEHVTFHFIIADVIIYLFIYLFI